jgi:hypothetical protein
MDFGSESKLNDRTLIAFEEQRFEVLISGVEGTCSSLRRESSGRPMCSVRTWEEEEKEEKGEDMGKNDPLKSAPNRV